MARSERDRGEIGAGSSHLDWVFVALDTEEKGAVEQRRVHADVKGSGAEAGVGVLDLEDHLRSKRGREEGGNVPGP